MFLSDTALDVNQGAKGDQILWVEFGDDVDLDDFELVEENGYGSYRECSPT